MSHVTVPVRTEVIRKILDVVKAEVPELLVVRAFTAPPTDLLGIELPAAYLIEIQPEDRTYSNRLAIAKMHLMFLKTSLLDRRETSFADMFEMMDIIAARLHAVYHSNVGLSKNGLVNVVEIQYDRIITNDAVGVLTSTFDVEYRHDRGNAFS
jgi:hypothetical protein